MSGGKWKQEQIALQAIKREKHHQLKQTAKKRDDIAKNFGFCDEQEIKTCENCFTITGDVYRYRVELPRLRNRITGFPVMNLCSACYTGFSDEGAHLVSLSDVKADDTSPARNIYDDRPRIKLF